MASGIGRSIRIVTGVALIAFGLLRVKGVRGGAIAALGLVPLLAGSFDVCVLAPLLRVPFKGSDVRVGTEHPGDMPSDISVQ